MMVSSVLQPAGLRYPSVILATSSTAEVWLVSTEQANPTFPIQLMIARMAIKATTINMVPLTDSQSKRSMEVTLRKGLAY